MMFTCSHARSFVASTSPLARSLFLFLLLFPPISLSASLISMEKSSSINQKLSVQLRAKKYLSYDSIILFGLQTQA